MNRPPAHKTLVNVLWLGAGWVAVGLGAAGVVLPLLPTTPFLILAAFCFSRGSERLHHWLITHRVFGPPLADWREHRAVSTRAKSIAIVAMAAVFAFSIAMSVPAWALAAQCTVLVAVAVFLLTRPSPPAG